MQSRSCSRLLSGLLLATVLALPAMAAVPPGNGASTYDIMFYSGCCLDSPAPPIVATENIWHAFFTAPGTPAVAPGVTMDVTTDLSTLNNYDMLYIAQSDIDALSGANMTAIRNWANSGGTLVINNHDGSTPGVSAFGSFVGPAYAFTAVNDPSGDTIVVTDPTNPLLTTPNVLTATDLSGWGSSVHGAFASLGSAYSCAADSSNGTTSAPVLCRATLGVGNIVLTGFDPECSCHDDHLTGGTNSGSEMWENFVLLGPGQAVGPVPTLSEWAMGLLVGLLMLVGLVSQRRYTS